MEKFFPKNSYLGLAFSVFFSAFLFLFFVKNYKNRKNEEKTEK